MQEKGFSIIELLVVVTLIAIITAVSLPAFRQFSNAQNLKSAAVELKTDARSTQNKALAGIKNNNNERASWIIRISNANSYYEVAGCTLGNKFGTCKDYLNNYERKELEGDFKIYACTYPCSNLTQYSGITLVYSPIDSIVSFYPFNPGSAAAYENALFGVSPNIALSINKISLLLNSTTSNAKSIFTINSKGDIIEND